MWLNTNQHGTISAVIVDTVVLVCLLVCVLVNTGDKVRTTRSVVDSTRWLNYKPLSCCKARFLHIIVDTV